MKEFHQAKLMLLLTSYLFPSTRCFWTDCQNILRNVLSFITQEECDQDQTYFVRHTKILSLKLLFKRRVAHEMPFALEEIIMKDVSRNIQLWICRICGKITAMQECLCLYYQSAYSQQNWQGNDLQ